MIRWTCSDVKQIGGRLRRDFSGSSVAASTRAVDFFTTHSDCGQFVFSQSSRSFSHFEQETVHAKLESSVGGLLTMLIVVAVGGYSVVVRPTETTVTEIARSGFANKWEPTFIGCNQGWIIFDDFVLVIDANFPNQAEEIIPLIRKTTDKPIRYVFDTHYHGDHADGNPVFHRIGATAIASQNARDEFMTKGLAGFEASKKQKEAEYGKLNYQLPALYFPRKLVIEDSKQRVELIHLAHGHTKGTRRWLPKQGILFATVAE